jgi:4-amino-4-deoxy-L-arabinose transferase-like glycosyltransferase
MFASSYPHYNPRFHSMRFRTGSVHIPVIILLSAVVLRVYGIGWLLPEVHEEALPLRKAWDMAGWGIPRGVDMNPHFFHYPGLVLYIQLAGQVLLYLMMKIFGAVDSTTDYLILYIVRKTPFYLMGRTITALFGIATVWLTYMTGRAVSGRRVGIGAAVLLAVNTVHISHSQVVGVDVPLTCFVMLALWTFLRIVDTSSLRNSLIAGCAIGLATSTKYTGAILLFPLLTAILTGRRRTHEGRQFGPFPARHTPLCIHIGVALFATVAVFLITSPYVLLDATTFWNHFSGEGRHMHLGHFGIGGAPTWLFYTHSLTDKILGWPLALVSLCGLVYLTILRRRSRTLIPAAFSVPYLLILTTWSMRADRYLLPVLPVALLFACAMVDEGFILLRRFNVKHLQQDAVFLVTVILLGVPLLLAYPAHLDSLKPDSLTEAREWIEQNAPVGSFVVSEYHGPEIRSFHSLEPFTGRIRQRILEEMSEAPLYAVLHLPMFQVEPERSEAFYDISLYDAADYMITSSMLRARYEKNPARFRQHLIFYSDLETHYEKVKTFEPRRMENPVLTVYKNPHSEIPFCGNRNVSGPCAVNPSLQAAKGSKADFYYRFGYNYEFCGHFARAIECYRLAFSDRDFKPSTYSKVVFGTVRCLTAMGANAKAVQFIDRMIASTPVPEIRESFRRLRQQLIE